MLGGREVGIRKHTKHEKYPLNKILVYNIVYYMYNVSQISRNFSSCMTETLSACGTAAIHFCPFPSPDLLATTILLFLHDQVCCRTPLVNISIYLLFYSATTFLFGSVYIFYLFAGILILLMHCFPDFNYLAVFL